METNQENSVQQNTDQHDERTQVDKPEKSAKNQPLSDGQRVTLPEWDKKDPPPMKDGSEQFWCQSSVKQVFLIFKNQHNGVNYMGDDLNDVLDDFINQFGDISKDSLVLVPTGHLQRLLTWLEGSVTTDLWNQSVRRTITAILKRLVRYKVKYNW